MDDVGNDCRTLAAAGIEVRSDNRSPALMHHKFAIIDDLTVLSGSFNWSRSASTGSHGTLQQCIGSPCVTSRDAMLFYLTSHYN